MFMESSVLWLALTCANQQRVMRLGIRELAPRCSESSREPNPITSSKKKQCAVDILHCNPMSYVSSQP